MSFFLSHPQNGYGKLLRKNTRQIEVREESFPWSVVSVVRNEGRPSERAACRLHNLGLCSVLRSWRRVYVPQKRSSHSQGWVSWVKEYTNLLETKQKYLDSHTPTWKNIVLSLPYTLVSEVPFTVVRRQCSRPTWPGVCVCCETRAEENQWTPSPNKRNSFLNLIAVIYYKT